MKNLFIGHLVCSMKRTQKLSNSFSGYLLSFLIMMICLIFEFIKIQSEQTKMRDKIDQIINEKSEKPKKIKSIWGETKKVRIFKRQMGKHGVHRILSITLLTPAISVHQTMLNQAAKEEETEIRALKRAYDLQQEVRCQYVIKNMTRKQTFESFIRVQEDYQWLLSEYSVSGLSLQKRLDLIYSVAKGIKYLQEKLICHRNICPMTICIVKASDQQHLAKINYFENAVVLDTPKSLRDDFYLLQNSFSSPELQYQKSYGLKSDIWSLGCLANYILYQTTQNIKIGDEQVKVEVPNHTPQWLQFLLSSMLEFDPRKRQSINPILDILKTTKKCMQVLNKYVPIGKDSFKTIKKQQE